MPAYRPRVAVIGGGENCEHEVSLASAAAVVRALDPGGYDVLPLTIDRDGRWLGASGVPLAPTRAASVARAVFLLGGCDVAIPMVHGPHGEDGSLAALCELAGVAYVGSGVRAGAIAMDKHATKLVARSLGIDVAAGEVWSRLGLVPRPARPATGSGPCIIKPVAAGSSHGVHLATTPAEMDAAVAHALTLDDRVLIEEVLIGDEIDVPVLRRADGSLFVGPPLRIVTDGVFDTTAKYDGSAQFEIPAAVSDVVAKEVRDAALDLYEALGCDGVARFDFFATDRGVVLNEVNTCPGFTEHSQVPMMFAAVGLPYGALVEELVRAALTGTVRA